MGKTGTKKFNFAGYATKANVRCKDGRRILKDCFKANDGTSVPLVWQHSHDTPENVLGHAELTNTADGVYAKGYFNNTERAKIAKELVENGDIKYMSICANHVEETTSGDVMHGNIVEVSLVISPANPGAVIEQVSFMHGDDIITVDDEVIIYSGEEFKIGVEGDFQHDDAADGEGDETEREIYESMNEKQRTLLHNLVGEALASVEGIEQSDSEGDKVNLFEKKKEDKKPKNGGKTFTHSEIESIFKDAQKCGSLKKATLEHAATYGIEDIEYLFPDAKELNATPEFISRDMEWVSEVLNDVSKTPFSKIKMTQADITADEARAKGYVKGNLKKEEVIKLLKREISATTVYKKQKLDRDDILEITSFDVVAWLKAEMRVMLNEELARAYLIGDGREADDPDKIDDEKIIPIWKEHDLYVVRVVLPADTNGEGLIEGFIRSKEQYKGSGGLKLFAAQKILTDLLLLKDKIGRRIYTEETLMKELGVKKIVPVELMSGLTRTTDDGKTVELLGIAANLRDYVVGATKGGQMTFFEDFDIDYNQYKYLYETRHCGALRRLKSAIIIEKEVG